MSDSETMDLRQAFGQFATGVTIVTTASESGEPIGVTANSFSSVSLSPPMVLWSLMNEAYSRDAFEAAGYFCVHVLTTKQREISERFATSGEDKFDGVAWHPGEGGVPMLDEYVARFECRIANRFPVGDHTVFVGEVLRFDINDKRPLVFHGGQYALAERRMMENLARKVDEQQPYPGDRRKRRK